ncbi:unnamed protein product [Rodentolepis nana]|uniref:Copine domain-containing protein n=2 Tax=Hymenolepididae TaxID=6214 RepID=A0A0R3TNI7_RODNA|nr:unnamed protein product [Rodentolepis nana]
MGAFLTLFEDSDNLFPAYGFGARIRPDNLVSHNFPLNGHPENPFCQGIAGVMEAYRYALQTVTLHGPTNFAPIITQVANLAQQTDDGSQYYILLILTDGIICDMPQTKAAVVNASRLPISIIIVGIGAADFSAMEELDGDEIRLTSRGRIAERDIVQFVPFDDFVSLTSVMDTKRQLARAVLAEIPEQLISYMRSKGYKPRNLTRKQSHKKRTELANNNAGSVHVGNSHTHSRHIQQPMDSPSAPPFDF